MNTRLIIARIKMALLMNGEHLMVFYLYPNITVTEN